MQQVTPHYRLWPYSRGGVAIVAALSVLWLSIPAFAQSGQSLQSRLDRLERDIQTLSRAVYRGEKPPQTNQQGGGDDAAGQSDFRANIQVQLSDLEQRLSELTGKYQQNRHRVDKLEQRLETALGDIQMRLKKLENAQEQQQKSRQEPKASVQQLTGNGEDRERQQSVVQGVKDEKSTDEAILGTITTKSDGQSATGTTPDNVSQASSDNSSNPGEATGAYERAFAKLKDGQYESAAAAFQRYIDNHPDHKLVQNARYWLGESYYARNQYERAARTFADAYQKHPKGKKAADNLLKLGLSLEAMDRKKDACVALNQLKQKFSNTSGPVIRRADKEIERIGCK